MKNYYDILGVQPDASDKEIKKAYRKLAKANHPDQHPNDPSYEAIFAEIQEAYTVLSDPDKRKEYDEQLANPPQEDERSYEDIMKDYDEYTKEKVDKEVYKVEIEEKLSKFDYFIEYRNQMIIETLSTQYDMDVYHQKVCEFKNLIIEYIGEIQELVPIIEYLDLYDYKEKVNLVLLKLDELIESVPTNQNGCILDYLKLELEGSIKMELEKIKDKMNKLSSDIYDLCNECANGLDYLQFEIRRDKLQADEKYLMDYFESLKIAIDLLENDEISNEFSDMIAELDSIKLDIPSDYQVASIIGKIKYGKNRIEEFRKNIQNSIASFKTYDLNIIPSTSTMSDDIYDNVVNYTGLLLSYEKALSEEIIKYVNELVISDDNPDVYNQRSEELKMMLNEYLSEIEYIENSLNEDENSDIDILLKRLEKASNILNVKVLSKRAKKLAEHLEELEKLKGDTIDKENNLIDIKDLVNELHISLKDLLDITRDTIVNAYPGYIEEEQEVERVHSQYVNNPNHKLEYRYVTSKEWANIDNEVKATNKRVEKFLDNNYIKYRRYLDKLLQDNVIDEEKSRNSFQDVYVKLDENENFVLRSHKYISFKKVYDLRSLNIDNMIMSVTGITALSGALICAFFQDFNITSYYDQFALAIAGIMGIGGVYKSFELSKTNYLSSFFDSLVDEKKKIIKKYDNTKRYKRLTEYNNEPEYIEKTWTVKNKELVKVDDKNYVEALDTIDNLSELFEMNNNDMQSQLDMEIEKVKQLSF